MGFFKVERDIFDHEIFSNVVLFRLFMLLMGKAVFAKEGVEKGGVLIKRGEYLRSFRGLQKDLEYVENRAIKQYSLSVIKRGTEKLAKKNMIASRETELGTVWTVLNYAKYQDSPEDKDGTKNATWNSVGTPEEHRENNNKKVEKEENISLLLQDDEPEASEEENSKNPFVMYQTTFGGFPTPIITDDINQYLDSGMEKPLVAFAIWKAGRNGGKWPYARGILNTWQDKGFKTYEQALQEEEQFKKKRHLRAVNGGGGSNKNVRKDKVPDYIANEQQPPELSDEEKAKKQAELKTMLSKYKN